MTIDTLEVTEVVEISTAVLYFWGMCILARTTAGILKQKKGNGLRWVGQALDLRGPKVSNTTLASRTDQ